jgi:hypothetical protein
MTKAEADKLKKLADYGAYEPIERARGYPYDYVIMQSDLNNIIDSMTEDTDPRLEELEAENLRLREENQRLRELLLEAGE